MISSLDASGCINKRRPLLVAWEANHGRDCSPPGWIPLDVAVLLPKAEPEGPHSIASPRSGPELGPQGSRLQQGLRSAGISPQIPESLVYPPQQGKQYVIIRATWAPISSSSFVEKPVLVAPHAGYIFIQTDKTIYTPEHLGTAPRT